MPESKQRHWFLTAWLFIIVIGGSAMVVLCLLLLSDDILPEQPERPAWWVPLLAVSAVANVIGAVALLKWKKWGFWVICAAAAVALVGYLSLGEDLWRSASFIGYVGVLYLALQIGIDNKGWPQLD
jgi:hypothetical protein